MLTKLSPHFYATVAISILQEARRHTPAEFQLTVRRTRMQRGSKMVVYELRVGTWRRSIPWGLLDLVKGGIEMVQNTLKVHPFIEELKIAVQGMTLDQKFKSLAKDRKTVEVTPGAWGGFELTFDWLTPAQAEKIYRAVVDLDLDERKESQARPRYDRISRDGH